MAVRFFDLPTNTKTERRHAAQFRKALEKDGFTMMQYSVYVRHCPSKENLEVHMKRVRRSMPPSGFTSLLAVTDKQYGDMKNFWGPVERARPETPQQLEFFDIFVTVRTKKNARIDFRGVRNTWFSTGKTAANNRKSIE